MATQTLEFNAGTGLTISCKLFAVGSDTVVATATATEKTNDDNRYAVEFTDVAAGAYRLNGFVSSVGGFANEIYDLTLATATFYPRSETKMRGTDGANTTAPLTSEQTQTAAAAALTAYDPPTRTEATADKDAVLSAISGAKSTPDKIAVRSSDDTTPVRFAWPTSGETITVERSLNNAAYEAATGTVSFFRTEGTEHWYTLAYNAADRAVGVVRYRLNDGTITRYVTLRVELPTLTAANVWEHATRSLTTFGTLVSDIWSAGTRTLTAISDSSGVTTLLGRILGTIRTSADDVTAETAQTTAVRSGLALEATVDAAETAILAAIDGIEGSGLTGDYTLTVTVTDATDDEPIEAATVTLFRSGERGVEPTDDEGEAIFGVDAATWSYVVRAAGYESATGTKVIAANDTLAVDLTPIVVNQAAAPACNVVLPVIDQYLAPAAEVLVCIEFLSFLPNATKTAVIVNHPPSLLSDANGQVEVTLARLAKYRATYQVRNESPKRVEFSTPNAGSFIVVEA
jgi:hypothetical protein